MGDRGPAPKPTVLRKLEGNPGKRALNTNEPQPSTGAPDRPQWMSPDALAEWDRVVPELDRLGLLTKVDGAALEGYCMAYARWLAAEAAIAVGGLTFTTDKGNVVQHPAVGIANTALTQIRAFCKEFGLTPSARSRMELPDRSGVSADPLERMLG